VSALPSFTIDELRHVYRCKLLALDRRRNDSIEAPRPPFWIRAAVIERIRAVDGTASTRNGERKANKPRN
jgi:hypothetical protein